MRPAMAPSAVLWLSAGGGPVGEAAQRVSGGAVGVGGVDDDDLVEGRGDGEGFVAALELADERVAEPLGAGAVLADVVGRPAFPEVVAAHRQLADELGE